MRPCHCDNFVVGESWVIDRDCRPCWLYHNDARYTRLWDGIDLPMMSQSQLQSQPHPSGCLAGTELKKLFSTFGLKPKAKCNCNKHARKMDEAGCDWCEQHIDRITGWIKHECRKMGVPFAKPLVVAAIRLAISRARKKAGAAKTTPA